MPATPALPQAGTTSLHGVALDKSGASIEGAKISVVNTAQGIKRGATSSSSGEFEFLALPPGTYTLNAEKDGFKRYEQPGIQRRSVASPLSTSHTNLTPTGFLSCPSGVAACWAGIQTV
ncbi:MAG TPA: carboxypeptidase-like regulatory domain-containing protein [Candidatus Dormibacteraeota bacterium]|nr:carboxypeptidase-like regulatory domain-containing protein [Candidatus Dormibacteraeota bacterium]